MRGIIAITTAVFLAAAAATTARAGGKTCGEKPGKKADSTCSLVCKEATMIKGVKQISYDQFQAIRNSGEGYLLLDVLGEDSYAAGHIEGSKSLPVTSITKETAAGMIPAKDATVVVYCGSFKCPASTQAAKKLTDLGYTSVLDYKGGLKEWKEKGNELVK